MAKIRRRDGLRGAIAGLALPALAFMLLVFDAGPARAFRCWPGGAPLVNHAANQQVFAFICSTSIGFTTLDSSVCAQSVFNSPTIVSGFQISEVIGTVLTGDPGAAILHFAVAHRPPVRIRGADPTGEATERQ